MDSVKMKSILGDIKKALNLIPNKRFNIREKVQITLEHTTGQADRFTLLTIRLDNNNLVIQCSRGVVIYPDKNILPYEVIQTLFELIVKTKSNICTDCEFLVGYLEYTRNTILLSLKHAIQAHPTGIVTFSYHTPDIYDNSHRYQLRSLHLEDNSIIVCFDESVHGQMIELSSYKRLDEMGIYFLQELLKRLSNPINIL